ncbi:MAG: nucleotide sugar dehydrogenase [Planctomycetota bacterium]|jgi:UDP-N-acetyl-D-mannosaminuronic acid dehydrogenase
MSGAFEHITVIGLGYIGLPTASILATHGFRVTGVDIDEGVLKGIGEGRVHIDESGLSILVKAAVKSGNLTVSPEAPPSDAFIIAVPTPLVEDTLRADISHVETAAGKVAKVLAKGNLVVLESTSPPGTTEDVVIPKLSESGLKAGEDFSVAYCPERVLPGRILTEMVENNRIIGGIDDRSRRAARELYASFVEGEIVLSDPKTAEVVKLVENSFRDTNIAFANELSAACESLGIDVQEVIALANKHPRVQVLNPGPGVGGHCLPIDPWFLHEKAPDLTSITTSSPGGS